MFVVEESLKEALYFSLHPGAVPRHVGAARLALRHHDDFVRPTLAVQQRIVEPINLGLGFGLYLGVDSARNLRDRRTISRWDYRYVLHLFPFPVGGLRRVCVSASHH